MQKRSFRDSGLELSALGFGTWQFGQKGAGDYWGLEFTDTLAVDLSAKALEAGVTYFDTAEAYAEGDSEKQLGRVLKELSPELRSKIVIGSKITPNHCGDVAGTLAATLERLGIDCIDLYMVHWPIDKNSMAHFVGGTTHFGSSGEVDEASVPTTKAAFTALAAAQQAGKIKNIGVSNFGRQQLEEALAAGARIASNEVCYNLIFRAAELEILPFCEEKGIACIAYSPLMQGILTGRWRTPDEVPDNRARTRHFNGKRQKNRHGEEGHEKLLFETLERLRAVSEEEKIPLGDLALAYPLHRKCIISVIAGATNTEQLASNVKAISRQLSPAVIEKLNAATEDLKQAMGSNCDLWQGGENGRVK